MTTHVPHHPSLLPPVMDGIASFAASYDGFILDIWGVLHNGVSLFDGALDCLRWLAWSGKPVILLTNAPRRAGLIAGQLTKLGLDRSLYRAIVSSGELVWRALYERSDPWHGALEGPVFQIGPDWLADLFADQNLAVTDQPEKAGFVLVTGPARGDAQLEEYQGILERIRACSLPMICANPDRWVRHGQKLHLCAGAIAARYEEMGGNVHYHGKPCKEAFDSCLELLPGCLRSRVMVVGDSLATDIRGANEAELDSLFVASGLHGEIFKDGEEPELCLDIVEKLFTSSQARPSRIMPELRW